jgi:hypothetical protein
MKVIVYLLGFGLIALCTCLILFTRETVAWLKGLYSAFQLKYLAVIPALFGLLFLIAASATAHPWVLRIMGLLALAEAVVAFVNPGKIYSQMLDWYFEKITVQTHRLFGIIGIIFGTAILTWMI